MRIKDGERVPRDAVARIRAKTLFGEKFVDLDLAGTRRAATARSWRPGTGSAAHRGRLRARSRARRPLPAAGPRSRASTARSCSPSSASWPRRGRGLGDEINRTLVNGASVADVFAEHVDDTSQFLSDFADLSGQLADSAEDLVGDRRSPATWPCPSSTTTRPS